MKLRIIVFIYLMACFLAPEKGEAAKDSWIVEPPSSVGVHKVAQSFVEPKYVYEVVASRCEDALALLENKTIVPLDDDMAKALVGGHYAREGRRKAYLVRAVYRNMYTGSIQVLAIDQCLWVLNSYMGSGGVQKRTAIVVQLASEPVDVYVTTGASE